MAISSVSRVYDAPDPIMTTDLELLAKVNTFQQSKFDTGSEAIQNEVNKWSLMTNIAKKELREYANQKLNKLVSGINNLGGVNLGDINNVNSLRSLGYNIYGDQRITDGIATTQKMKSLASASQTKLSGKDADKYDATVADYLMKGYQKWASDGNVENTRYDGPVDLPQGNMNTVNAKVQKYLKELKPDSDSAPSGDLQKSYGYFQVEGKWLKGNRIQEAIDATVDENDSLIFKAHGWKALNSTDDKSLINNLGLIYDNTSSSIKNQINYLQGELNTGQSMPGDKKIEINRLIGEQKSALTRNENEKNQWFNKAQLNEQEREGIQESLYKNAWKSNVTNSFAYNQESKELKSNMPLIFHDRMQQQAYQWSKEYDLNVSEYELKKEKQQFDMQQELLKNSLTLSLNGGSNLPLTQETNTGENNQQKSPQAFMDDINTKYFGLNTGYYQHIYNLMGANDTNGRFAQVGGVWKPKPEYKGQIEKEIGLITSKLDNYSNLTEEERKGLNLPVGEDELKEIFAIRNQINTYGTYKRMAEDKESEIINHAIAKNSIPFDWRKISLTLEDGSKVSVDEALALNNAKIYSDDLKITSVSGTSNLDKLPGFIKNAAKLTLKDIKKDVNNFREKAKKSYQQVGGKMFNSYSVPIPFSNQPKALQEIIQKQLSAKAGDIDYESIEPLKGKIEFNFETGKPEYKLQVQTGKGKTLKSGEIDVTEMVQNSPGSGIGLYFPKSDVSLIWGLNLNNNGATPFSKNDNYKDALRTYSGNYPYQISTMPNALNGTTGLKVKVALPIGEGNTVEVNVKNLQNGSFTFPSSIESVQQYLNNWLSTPELKARFYKEHGLTVK